MKFLLLTLCIYIQSSSYIRFYAVYLLFFLFSRLYPAFFFIFVMYLCNQIFRIYTCNLFVCQIQKQRKMSTQYQRLLKQYNIPSGVLTQDELRMLKHGGIKLEDSDNEDQGSFRYHEDHQRSTQPRLPKTYGGSDLQAQSIRQIYQGKISMKDKQIDFLQAQLSRRDQLLEAQRYRLKEQHQIERRKTLQELNKARAKVVHSQGQIPLIKEALSQVRQMLSGTVSQAVYLRLKDMPERELPPSQWLLVNVWEMVYPYRKELQFARKDLSGLRDQVRMMNDKQNSCLNQLAHYQRLLQAKDDDQKRHALNYDNNRKCLQLELQKLREQVELNREKGARYDELLRDYQFTKQEKELMQEKLNYYDKQTGKDSGITSKISQEEAQRRKTQLLQQDKQYLTKENIELLEKNRRLQDRLDRLQAQLLSQKNRSQDLIQQLCNIKTDSASSYQEKIYRQIAQLKQKHNHEMQATKNNLVDVYETQIRFLKDAHETKQLKLQQIQRELREKNKQYEQLMIDSRSFQRKFDGDLAETRISLKIKTEELDRVNNIYQETLGNLKGTKLENECLREKVACMKGEYYKSQANSKDEMSGLKAQVAVLRQQLASYQLIEKQIDEAVMSLGNLKPNDNNIFTATLHSIPSSNKRRIQQALGLAQRLQAKQREHEQTLDLLHKRERELETCQDEIKVARSLLDKTNQPYSYLVGNLEQKQRQILALRNQNRKLDQTSEDIKAEYRELKRQLQQAEKDVQRLLVKRESIQHIQQVLIELSRGPTTPAQIQNAVEGIRDILGNTRNLGKTNQFGTTQHDYNTSNPDKQRSNQVPSWYRKLTEKKK